MIGGIHVTSSRLHQDLAQELRRLTRGEVRFDAYSRALYNTDASLYQMEPIGVVAPLDAEDVAATVRLAHYAGTPVLPRGGGTSLAGQTVNHAVVLDTSKYMRELWEVNAEEEWAWVGPGLVLDELNHLVAPHGLKFAPDPSTVNRATVGGAIGNNSCGARSIRYGKTLDHVLELEVVLSDGTRTMLGPADPERPDVRVGASGLDIAIHRGAPEIAAAHREEIARRFPRIERRVSGYNLDELLNEPLDLSRVIVGSEGTLAVVTAAKVRLVPQPKAAALAVLHFSSVVEAMEATVALLEADVSAVELVDKNILDAARGHLELARRMGFVEGDPAAVLLVEATGDSPEEARAALTRARELVKRRGGGGAVVTVEAGAAQADVWAVRRSGLGLLRGVRGDAKPLPFVEDTAVSPEKLPEYVRRFEEIVQANGTTAAYYGHAAAGCLHIRPLVNVKEAAGVERMVRIAEEVADLVLEFGGALSGEHGDGIVRGGFTEKMFGPELYQAFRDLKRLFDPRGILNPGKIVDSPPMTENLRIGPAYRPLEVETTLDFSREQGFAAAVEQCNGQGACRKTQGGAMCPSYMATREEEHSTRGRANALRAVLSGVLPASEFTSRRMHDVLDLCLECKACKAECPSGVDMAKIKYEFLGHYYRNRRPPLRARLFANVARLNRIGCRLAPLSNWAMASPPARWVLSRLGVHPKRRLPAFARKTFSSWFKKHTPHDRAGTRGMVLLFHDTYTEGNYPGVGAAATRLLEQAGFKVTLAPRWCCGRPMVSKGLLEQAREHARHNVELLHSFVAVGTPIVGIEPSCLLTLRDEYPDLLPGNQEAQAVAANSFLLDEFLSKTVEEGNLDLELQPRPGRVLLHGHCHQKAMTGLGPALRLLRQVPEAEVEALDAGCCGMAGAFGFEREHYEVSMQIGERALFPAVRRSPDATVVVTGVSCRQQVEHGTGVRPLHLAEFLASALPAGEAHPPTR